jgi:hypothetical protein
MVGSEKAKNLPIRPYIFEKSLDLFKNPSLFEPFGGKNAAGAIGKKSLLFSGL